MNWDKPQEKKGREWKGPKPEGWIDGMALPITEDGGESYLKQAKLQWRLPTGVEFLATLSEINFKPEQIELRKIELGQLEEAQKGLAKLIEMKKSSQG
jgi:hypothetical protein